MEQNQKKAKLEKFYSEHPEAWIKDFVKIYDPGNFKNPEKPFTPFAYQKNLFKTLKKSLDEGSDYLIEKSRQIGCTWTLAAFVLWAVIFRKDFAGLVMSYKESLVASKTTESIFGKIRFMLLRLPEEYRNRLDVGFNSISCKETGASAIGETSNTRSGRGGTYSFVWLDEFAHFQDAEEIYQSVRSGAKSLWVVSTPFGKNFFYKLRTEYDFKILTIDYRQDPRKNSPEWLTQQKKKMSKLQLGQEVLIDYINSSGMRIFPELSTTVHLVSDAVYDEGLRDMTFLAADFGTVDQTVFLLFQKNFNAEIILIDEIYGRDRSINFWVDVICGIESEELLQVEDEEEKARYKAFIKRSHDLNYLQFPIVCGHEVRSKSFQTRKSIWDTFTRAGDFRLADNAQGMAKQTNRRYRNLRMISEYSEKIDRIEETKKLLNPKNCKIFISSKCPMTWEALNSYSYQKSREKPVHDWCSDFADAFTYFIHYTSRRTVFERYGGIPYKSQVFSRNRTRDLSGFFAGQKPVYPSVERITGKIGDKE